MYYPLEVRGGLECQVKCLVDCGRLSALQLVCGFGVLEHVVDELMDVPLLIHVEVYILLMNLV